MTIKKTDIRKPTSIEKKQSEAGQLKLNALTKKIADVFNTRDKIEVEHQSKKKGSPDKSSRAMLSQDRRKQQHKAQTAAINSNNSFNNVAIA